MAWREGGKWRSRFGLMGGAGQGGVVWGKGGGVRGSEVEQGGECGLGGARGEGIMVGAEDLMSGTGLNRQGWAGQDRQG